MVASVAIAHDAVIMTCNARDFMRVHELFPLPGLFDPLRREWHVRPLHDMRLPPWERGERQVEASLPRIGRSDQTAAQ